MVTVVGCAGKGCAGKCHFPRGETSFCSGMDNVDIRASRSIENVTVRGSRVSLLAVRCCPHKLIVLLLKIAWPREKVEEQ